MIDDEWCLSGGFFQKGLPKGGAWAKPLRNSIANDLERTFSDMPMVAPRKPQICRILEEFGNANPEIGYTQGMNYVAATLVLKFHPREDTARKKFNEVLLQFSGFWSDGFPLLSVGVELYQRLAERHLPNLSNHFNLCGVEPLSYLPNGWLSLFGKWLPLPAVIEAMDLFIESGLRGVLAVTLALFHMQQRRLIAAHAMEHVLELINQDFRTSPIDGELLVKCARLWLPSVNKAVAESQGIEEGSLRSPVGEINDLWFIDCFIDLLDCQGKERFLCWILFFFFRMRRIELRLTSHEAKRGQNKTKRMLLPEGQHQSRRRLDFHWEQWSYIACGDSQGRSLFGWFHMHGFWWWMLKFLFDQHSDPNVISKMTFRS